MKLYIGETERYPDYYVRADEDGTNIEVDAATWRRWRAAEKAYDRFQKEAKKVYEDQVGETYHQRVMASLLGLKK